MARIPLTPSTFGVVYITDRNAIISVGTIKARDYWAACKAAWKDMRKGRRRAVDFLLIEDAEIIAAGPSRIRAAAAEIVDMRTAERQPGCRDC